MKSLIMIKSCEGLGQLVVLGERHEDSVNELYCVMTALVKESGFTPAEILDAVIFALTQSFEDDGKNPQDDAEEIVAKALRELRKRK